MGRPNRYFPSLYAYEIVMRVKEGLPFPCWRLIKLLLKSAMARAARNQRIQICHFVWMGNHLHIIVVVNDATDVTSFYGELQKRLTEYVKMLSGKKHLSMWEGRPQVAPILDPEKIKKRVVYTYLNPARAGLVNSIEDYPGFTSWKAFKSSTKIDSRIVEQVPLIRIPKVPKLPSSFITPSMDSRLTDSLIHESKETDELIIEPNAWAKCYGIMEDELNQFNQSIRSLVKEEEEKMFLLRQKSSFPVIGPKKLCCGQFLKAHTPKKNGPKVRVLASDESKRLQFIKEAKRVAAKCKMLYIMRAFDNWPPGTFRPPVPPTANLLARW